MTLDEHARKRMAELSTPLEATMTGTLTGTPADQDRQLIIAQEIFAGRLVPADDAAIERAARGLCEYGVITVDGKVATWEQYHRKLTQMAQVALNCAGSAPPTVGFVPRDPSAPTTEEMLTWCACGHGPEAHRAIEGNCPPEVPDA